MFMQVEKSILEDAINTVSRITVKSSVECTEQVLIDISESGQVILMCTDLKNTISKKFSVLNFKPGKILVQCKYLTAYIHKLKQEIIFESENNILKISSGRSKFSLNLIDVSNFPEEKLSKDDSSISTINITCSELKTSLKEILYALSNDESRPILTGLLMDINSLSGERSLDLVALDGYRAGVSHVTADISSNKDFKIVIPGKAMKELEKILPDSEDNISIEVYKKYVLFKLENFIFKSVLLEGEYVPWNKILPDIDSTKTSVIVPRSDFLESISRCQTALIGTNESLITLKFNGEILQIETTSAIGKTTEDLQVEKFQGDPLVIACNLNYLIDIISAISSEKVIIYMTTSTSPMLFRKIIDGELCQDFKGLMLPVRLTKE